MKFSKEQKIIGIALGLVALVAIVLVISNSGSEDPTTLQTQAPVAPQQQQQVTELRTFNVGVTEHPTLGPILAGKITQADTEKTLYTFVNDGQGVSNCTGDCAVNWPPFAFENADDFVIPPTIASVFSTIERADGLGYQVTYQGQPLYFYAGDAANTDANGNGLNGLWNVIVIPQNNDATQTQPQQ